MAITKTEVQITWPTAANSLSVSSASNGTSEAKSTNGATIGESVQLKADNNGTPAAGDVVVFKILYTNGDPDGASTDEYDDSTHAEVLARLDTNAVDPAIKTVEINDDVKGYKIFAENEAATNAITVSATATETRG